MTRTREDANTPILSVCSCVGVLALAAMLSGCITNTAGPTTVDVYNAGSQIVKVHVLFNTSIGHLIEEQVFIVGPANVDEKNVKATNATGRLLLDAFTESGLHLAAPISVTMSGATVNVNVTDTTLSAAATGK